jgi:hypothetical protein
MTIAQVEIKLRARNAGAYRKNDRSKKHPKLLPIKS